jgi:hypothetical protein
MAGLHRIGRDVFEERVPGGKQRLDAMFAATPGSRTAASRLAACAT